MVSGFTFTLFTHPKGTGYTILQAAEDARQMGEKRGERRAEQQTLIRLLRRKFGSLPESVISEIQSTMSAEQLSQWLDQLLDATSLQEMGFFVAPQNGKTALNLVLNEQDEPNQGNQ